MKHIATIALALVASTTSLHSSQAKAYGLERRASGYTSRGDALVCIAEYGNQFTMVNERTGLRIASYDGYQHCDLAARYVLHDAVCDDYGSWQVMRVSVNDARPVNGRTYPNLTRCLKSYL